MRDDPGPVGTHGDVPDCVVAEIIFFADLQYVVVTVDGSLDAGSRDFLELRLALEEHVDLVAGVTAYRRLARQHCLDDRKTRLVRTRNRGQDMSLLVIRVDCGEGFRQVRHVRPGPA